MLVVATTNAGRRAARIPGIALLLAVCLATTGCSLFKKRPDAAAAPAGAGPNVPPPRFPTAGDPLVGPGVSNQPTNNNSNNNNVPNFNTTAGATSVPGAILAGRVIDGFSRPPANTSIRWVSLDDKAATEQEVSVTPEGYFTIQGLKPGAHYKLMARGKQGDRLVAGVSYTDAPNIRVLIQVKEEFAGSSTPDVPAHPGATKMTDPPATSQNTTPPPGWNGAPNSFPGNPGNDNEPALPTSINVAPGAPSSAVAPSKDWMPGPALANQGTPWPPVLEIPRVKPTPPLQIPNVSIPNPPLPPKLDNRPGPAFPGAVSDLLDRARIPSCVRVGNRIDNLALNDINGEPWELKRQRKGKLVLVDFWGTWCKYCLDSAPFLNMLQSKYGAQGLEVVGIAYEQGGTPLEQGYVVGEMCKRLRTNYRQLLGAGNDCPVRREFRVRYYPSLFLLDEQGNVIWQEEGAPPPDKRQELERLIQLRLNPRVQ